MLGLALDCSKLHKERNEGTRFLKVRSSHELYIAFPAPRRPRPTPGLVGALTIASFKVTPAQQPLRIRVCSLSKNKDLTEHYLEGFKLTFYLLGEVLAVLTQLALLGGLGHGVLKLSFQLRKESSAFYQHKPAALRQLDLYPEGTLRERNLVTLRSSSDFDHKVKAEKYTSGLNWNGWLVIKQV